MWSLSGVVIIWCGHHLAWSSSSVVIIWCGHLVWSSTVQSWLGNKHIITSTNKHISGIFNVIHSDLMVTVGVLSKTL